ncbi:MULTISPECIES: hypothetical protein [Rhizobium]|uniref:Glycine zipper domain-containing protein n=1 Tax=Rhizobium aouanii TaxID=3118145 RepID=A0ABU8CUN3_9HYPH|nr:hypothetical protein [Rhizobium acaciae]MCW1754159.1 hypothetical protein [Rhizobium acaciae]
MTTHKHFLTRKFIAPVLIGTLLVTSCTTVSGDPSTMSSAEIALRQRQNEDVRIAQGVATGAVLGAAGGALLAALTGGDGRSIARGAITGGVIGGVAGGIDANNVNRGARAEAGQQDRYRTIIANADHNIAHYRRMNGVTSQLIAEENGRIGRLNGEYRAGKVDKGEYRRRLSGARGNLSIIDGQISKVERDISDLRSEGQNGAPVSSRVAQLQGEKSRLQSQRNALVTVYSRVPDDINLGV